MNTKKKIEKKRKQHFITM